MARYDGKPLLRLLECYVLWSIGSLPEKESAALEQMTPQLREIYGADGAWHEVIAAAVELPPDMPELVKKTWDRNAALARSRGATLTPQQFAELFVDANLAPGDTEDER
jgi:hypothetical protein